MHVLRALRTVALFAIPFLATGTASGQTVALRGHGEPELDSRIRAILRRPYLLITKDTVIGADQTIPTGLIVAHATVALEGSISGSVLVVDGNLFLRPQARVQGNLVNAGGGLYRSELATTPGDVVNRPLAPYRVVTEGGTLWIEGISEGPGFFVLEGAKGFSVPTYDRVNGLTPRIGAALVFPMIGRIEPEVRGHVGYRTARKNFVGGGEVALIRGRSMLLGGAEHEVYTNERWIRSDAENSLVMIYKGKDYRDYYDADRIYGELAHEWRSAGTLWGASVRLQREDARSLDARDVWSLLKPDSIRPNRPVNAGVIGSVIASAHGGFAAPTSALQVVAEIESGSGILGGDYDFTRYMVDLEYAAKAIANHALRIEGRFQGPLPGTESLPLQRWTFVGGSRTLDLDQIAAFSGDRVVFVRTRYIVPGNRRLRLPVVGPPTLQLFHSIGMAWSEGQSHELRQNVGVRLNVALIELKEVIDPADTKRNRFSVSVSLPPGKRPWEKLGEGPPARVVSRRQGS